MHHKSHIEKVLALVSTGFLAIDNDMTRGGTAFKIGCERAGRWVKAQMDTYKRVTAEDGSWKRPKIPANQLRKKGQFYFEAMEVTGSTVAVKIKTAKAKKPRIVQKYSLMHDWWMGGELQRLDSLTEELSDKHNCKVIVRYQWDGAGPHVERQLLEFLDYEFHVKRDWIFMNQPSQSPHTNAHDCAIFPALSKLVTQQQAMKYNGRYVMDPNKIWTLVKDAYNSYPKESIARACVHHHQMVNAIASCKGGDQYLKSNGGGLHCGVRRAYAPLYEEEDGEVTAAPTGVYVVQQQEDLSEQQNLKCAKPIADLEQVSLNDWRRMKTVDLEFLVENLPNDDPTCIKVLTVLGDRMEEE